MTPKRLKDRRRRKVTVSLSDLEMERLDKLASELGRTRTQIIRDAIATYSGGKAFTLEDYRSSRKNRG